MPKKGIDIKGTQKDELFAFFFIPVLMRIKKVFAHGPELFG